MIRRSNIRDIGDRDHSCSVPEPRRPPARLVSSSQRVSRRRKGCFRPVVVQKRRMGASIPPTQLLLLALTRHAYQRGLTSFRIGRLFRGGRSPVMVQMVTIFRSALCPSIYECVGVPAGGRLGSGSRRAGSMFVAGSGAPRGPPGRLMPPDAAPVRAGWPYINQLPHSVSSLFT